MKDDRVNFQMQAAEMMSFSKGFFLAAVEGLLAVQCSLGQLYHSSSLYENEAIVIQMGELCQQCAFDAWGIRYYTTHDHRLCTLPHADVSQRWGSKILSNRISNSCKLKIMSSITVNPFQKVINKLLAAHVKDNIDFGAGQLILFLQRDRQYKDNQNFENRSQNSKFNF